MPDFRTDYIKKAKKDANTLSEFDADMAFEMIISAMKNRSFGCCRVSKGKADEEDDGDGDASKTYHFYFGKREYDTILTEQPPATFYKITPEDTQTLHVGEIADIQRDPKTKAITLIGSEKSLTMELSAFETDEAEDDIEVERTTDINVLATMDYKTWMKATDAVRVNDHGKHEINREGVATLACANICYDKSKDQYYRFNGCVWEPLAEYRIGRAIRKLLHNDFLIKEHGRLSQDDIEAVIKVIGEQPIPPRPPNLIAWRDCVLNTDTGETCPFSSKYFLTVQYPIAWNEKAPDTPTVQSKCDLFRYIHTPENYPEIMKHHAKTVFRPYSPAEHIYIGYGGQGGTGKSAEWKCLQEIVGVDNVSHKDLSSLGGRFDTGDLEGRVIVACDEVSNADGMVWARTASRLKKISGKVPVENERKNVQSKSSFVNCAEIMMTTNCLPYVYDLDKGLQRRLLIPSMEKSVYQWTDGYGHVWEDLDLLVADHDSTLGLRDELWGVFCEMRNEGSFEVKRTSDMYDNLQLLIERGDDLARFLKDCCGGQERHEVIRFFCPFGPRKVSEIYEEDYIGRFRGTRCKNMVEFAMAVRDKLSQFLTVKPIGSSHELHFIENTGTKKAGDTGLGVMDDKSLGDVSDTPLYEGLDPLRDDIEGLNREAIEAEAREARQARHEGTL